MLLGSSSLFTFFFFNDTATTEIYTLSLHDALPISDRDGGAAAVRDSRGRPHGGRRRGDEDLEVTRAYAAGEHHHGMHGVQKPELLHDEEPAQAPRAGGVAGVLPAGRQAAATQGNAVASTEAPGAK